MPAGERGFPIPDDEQARLDLLRELDVLDTLPEEAYDDIARLAAFICGTPVSLVTLIDRDRQWFKARVNFEPAQTPRDQSFCTYAIMSPLDVMVVRDARDDARFRANPLVVGDPRIRFYAGAPLVTTKGLPLGTLCVIDHEPRDMTPAQLDALRMLSRQASHLLEGRRIVRALADVILSIRRVESGLEERRVARPLVRQLIGDMLALGGLERSTLQLLGKRLASLDDADLELALRAYDHLGLGQLALIQASDGRFSFRGRDLIERTAGARATTCHLSLGYLQGVVARATGLPTLGAEMECESRGDAACRFVVSARKPPVGPR